jgi:integrase
MKRAVARITEIAINGYRRFRLSYPTSEGVKREHFTIRKLAEKRLKEIKEEQARYGSEISGYTAMMRADAIAAMKELDGTGKTLLDAARFYHSHLLREMSGVPITEAVEAFIRSKDDRSDKYRGTIRTLGKYIGNFFAGQTTSGITRDDCQRFLDGIGGTQSPCSVAHYRTLLSVFFTFCESRGWTTGNPATKTASVIVKAPEAEILTPQEAATLLGHCPADILPGVALAMFCGLRQAEVARIDWRAVDLVQGTVTIGAGIAKTSSRRVCPIPANAKAWLASYAQESGSVWPATNPARSSWTLTLALSGYNGFFPPTAAAKKALQDYTGTARPWPANALRHSAISYRLAITPDLAKIAYESGNSPTIIQRHYNGLATPQAAKAFFSILPTVAKNVRQFKAA